MSDLHEQNTEAAAQPQCLIKDACPAPPVAAELEKAAIPQESVAAGAAFETRPNLERTVQPAPIAVTNALRPFAADAMDKWFALLFSLVGYFYIYATEKMLSYASGGFSPLTPELWLFPVFLCAYVAVVLGYLRARQITPAKESWVWLGVLLGMGLPFPFYSVAPLPQIFLLHLVALYWSLCAAGALLCGGKTGGALPFDALNAGLIVPWGNFFSHGRVLGKALASSVPHRRWGRRIAPVLLGLVLAVPVLFIVMPLLASADAAFYGIVNDIGHFLARWLDTNMTMSLWRIVLSLPVTCILFGAVYGAVHRRCTNVFNAQGLHAMREQVRVMPTAATATVFCVLAAVYILFLGLQGSYVFGAFAGRLPAAFSYSSYAREGFFELCRLGGVNLAVLAAANLLCRTPRRENRVLRICNVALCALSLLLTATAAAKIGMYIAAYGLTVNRVLPAVFLVWIAAVFTALLVWQVRKFSVVRFAVITLAVMVALTCAADVPDLCILANEARVRAGTLEKTPNYNDSYNVWSMGTYGMHPQA